MGNKRCDESRRDGRGNVSEAGPRRSAARPSFVALVALLPLLSGCDSSAAPQATQQQAPPAEGPAEFDGERSMEWLRRQVDAGFRIPGTEAHANVRRMLAEGLGPGTHVQEFTHATKRRGAVPMANLVAPFGPDGGTRILLCAHWDTRPFADQDPSPANRNLPIAGANDGASGVAVLMELARIFRESPPTVGVTIALFDGEDYGRTLDEMFLGASHFAKNQVGGPFRYAILLDMVGDADLQIPIEPHSQQQAPAVVDRVWKAAAELGYEEFRSTVGTAIYDDHLPLQKQGIPAIDVIDFDYPYWHTLQDLPDKCSARSLKVVGDVIRRVVYGER